jgi:shikimate kinase
MALNALGRHLALTGFMGAGKTTTAARLSPRLARPVVEVDRDVEARYGESIPHIFEAEGEEAFRRVEAHVLGEALERKQPTIVDLGGGAVSFRDNHGNL